MEEFDFFQSVLYVTVLKAFTLDPLSPNSDKHLFSRYSIPT